MSYITKVWGSGKRFIVAHKAWSGVIAIALIGGGWWVAGAMGSGGGQTRYVIGEVSQGTIASSVSESGQVTANDQLTITPQNVSGQVIAVYVKPGQKVAAGATIAVIDPTTAQQQVESAKESLQSAQLSLAQLQEPPTTLTLTQQQDALTQAQQNLSTLYQSTYSDITNAFLDLPTIISGLQDIDLGSEAAGNNSQWNIDYYEAQAANYSSAAQSYRNQAYNDYETARTSYNQTLADFQAVSVNPDHATTEKLLAETYQTTQTIATAVKSANSLLQFYSDELTQNNTTPKAVAATQITTLNSYLSKAQSHVTALLSDTNNLESDKESITEKKETLAQTQAGPDTLSVQSSQLNVQKAQEALDQAQQTLADCYITAPFAGTIASVPANKYDQAGSGTTIATLITDEQYADLSLNEVDAAKIALGDKATLTFDAIPSLTLTGTVAEINPVGTVSQGVVTYDVKIAFDAQNSQVKSGMSVNAAIQTAVAQNVLEVPSSAIKTQGGQSYVLVFDPAIASSTIAAAGSQGIVPNRTPHMAPVTTGVSNNTNTQITAGLTLGEQIVIRTVSGTMTAVTTSATTGGAGARAGGFGGNAGFGGGGAAVKIGG